MKKAAIILGAVIVILFGAWKAFEARGKMMVEKFNTAASQIGKCDLSTIPDGVYPGKFGDFIVSVALEVTIKDHRIVKIDIKDQSCGKGYDARETVARILEKQTPRVDVVSGATISSKGIMIATDRALRKK